jgi:4-aminobutyrate aminotransferase-like enzyme
MTGLSISTFGGNPVSCSAALATIEVVENEHLAENAARVGSYFFDKLSELQKKYPCMGDIRGKGLMIGIEIVRDNRDPDPETVLKIFEMTKKKRLLIGKGGLFGNVLRITPPLNINNTDVDEAVVVIDEVLGSL